MYTAKEKNRYISDVVWIIISEVLGLHYETENFDTGSISERGLRLSNESKDDKLRPDFDIGSIYEGGVRLKKNVIDSQLSPEACFDKWRNSIEVYGRGDNDEFIRSIEFEDDWLAVYIPMNSPGRIHLYLYRIKDCFAGFIRDLIRAGYQVAYIDFVNMAKILIRKILYHEYFHHYTDIQRHIYGSYHIKNTEEALAVAWSRIEIEKYCMNRKYLKIPSGTRLYDTYKKMIFNYCQPGYRDWSKYYIPDSDHTDIFCESIRQYTVPSGSSRLLYNGFNFDELILSNLNVIYQTSDAVTLYMIYR